VNVALAFVGLSHKQIGNMPSNAILVRDSVSTKHFLEAMGKLAASYRSSQSTYVRALIRARSQFCLLIMDIISGAALPSSFSLPTWTAARIP
jgi:hypothetical protein